MLRIFVKTTWGLPDGNKGTVEYKSFDIEAPEVETYLRKDICYGGREVVGAEVRDAD